MTVEQADRVDLIGIDANGSVILTISDHLDWSDGVAHQAILQKKLNRYLAFVESGEILEQYPSGRGRSVIIEVVFKYRPDREGELFLKRADEVIRSAGLGLRHEVFADSYDN